MNSYIVRAFVKGIFKTSGSLLVLGIGMLIYNKIDTLYFQESLKMQEYQEIPPKMEEHEIEEHEIEEPEMEEIENFMEESEESEIKSNFDEKKIKKLFTF